MEQIIKYKLYENDNNNFPIIISHGLYGSSDNWHSIAKSLSKYYKVLVVDNRNHGQSFHSEKHSYSDLAQDYKNLLTSLNINKANFIGHSMGGKAVLSFINNHPKLINRAIIVDIGFSKIDITFHINLINTMISIKIEKCKSRKEIQDKLFREIQNQTLTLFLLKNIKKDSLGNYKWKINLPTFIKNADNIGKGISFNKISSIPTLFIKGGKSDRQYNITEEDIKTKFLKYKLIEYSNAGHWLHAEEPAKFVKDTLEFFTK